MMGFAKSFKLTGILGFVVASWHLHGLPSGHAGISMAFFVRFLSFPRLSLAINRGYR
jgi:hypothetical protein